MLKPEERFFAELITEESGIILGEDKSYLISARLNPLARKYGYTNLKDFHEAVRLKMNAHLKSELVEALTTNETLFFRDLSPFRIIQNEFIPKYKSSHSRPIRVWCAAASTGQEPYSIIMSFLEKWPELTNRDLNVYCTDIDAAARNKGESGVYTQIEVNRGLPAMMLAKHFRQEGSQWIVSEKIRSFTTWRPINLTHPFMVPGPFDIILVRNVLIYFEVTVKKRILERVATLMKPDGILFLGASETTMGITDTIRSHPAEGGGCYFVRSGAMVPG